MAAGENRTMTAKEFAQKYNHLLYSNEVEDIKGFAELIEEEIIAPTREECARITDNRMGNHDQIGTASEFGYDAACEQIAAEIRKLGEETP